MWGLRKLFGNTEARRRSIPVQSPSELIAQQERQRKRDDRIRIAKVGNDWIVALPTLDGAFRHYELCNDFQSAQHIARFLLA